MHANLGSILLGSAETSPDRIALRLNERALTFADLDRQARGVAASLRAPPRVPVGH